MRRTWTRPVAFALALALVGPLTAGCYGKFALSKKIYDWNGSLGNKYVISLVYFILNVVPVYGISLFVDWVLLNVIEFWTGSNPVAMKEGETQERVVQREGGGELKMTLSDRGTAMRVEITEPGQAAKVMEFRKTDEGFTALDGSGRLVASGSVDASGAMAVRSADGAVLGSRTGLEMDALAAASARGTGSLLVAIEAQQARSGHRVATAR